MDHYRNPHAVTPGLLIRDAGLLILRWTAGLLLISRHAWDAVYNGWHHLWYKTPWPYAAEITERGFPLPAAVASASAVVALLGSAFLITGLLCRVSAAVLLVCALTGIFLYSSVPHLGDKLTLYAAIYAVLVLCGPGRFSADALLSGKRKSSR